MPGTAVTIGAYDGVHLGHRALLRDLSERARARGLSTVVVTFDRHPATVVRPASAPLLLTDLEQKLDPHNFFRIHRSTLLNLAWVKELDAWFGGRVLVRLKDAKGTELQVARERVQELKKRLGA